MKDGGGFRFWYIIHDENTVSAFQCNRQLGAHIDSHLHTYTFLLFFFTLLYLYYLISGYQGYSFLLLLSFFSCFPPCLAYLYLYVVWLFFQSSGIGCDGTRDWMRWRMSRREKE